MTNNNRAEHEIAHGIYLSNGDTETIWGWGTPAGNQRAARRAAMIKNAAHLNPNTRVLEIGCGTGLFTEIFAQSGSKLTAIDISPELLEKAKKRNEKNTNVEFTCGRFEDLKQPGFYDAVIGSSILHHLDLQVALPLIFNLIKPGGVMAFAEPNMLNPQVFAERTFLRKHLKYISPDETAFVRWIIKKNLKEIGFVKIDTVPFDWLHPRVPEAFIVAVNQIGLWLEKTPLVKEFAGSLIIYGYKPGS